MSNTVTEEIKTTIKEGNTEMIQEGKAKIYTKYITKT